MIGFLTMLLRECLFFLGYVTGGQQYPKPLTMAEEKRYLTEMAAGSEDARRELILHNLRQWGEGRTVIISAHRLSALTEASEILVLQHGHIAQRGRHEALAVQPGWYRDMYRYQQLEAALDEVPQTQEEALDA